MQIPPLPQGRAIDTEGNFTAEWINFLRVVTQALQTCLSDEGFKLPQQSAANIAQLNTQKSVGYLLYNTDTNKGMLNENGTFKTITTT